MCPSFYPRPYEGVRWKEPLEDKTHLSVVPTVLQATLHPQQVTERALKEERIWKTNLPSTFFPVRQLK